MAVSDLKWGILHRAARLARDGRNEEAAALLNRLVDDHIKLDGGEEDAPPGWLHPS